MPTPRPTPRPIASLLYLFPGGAAGGCSVDTAVTVGVDITLMLETPAEVRADSSAELVERMPFRSVVETVLASETSTTSI